MPARSRILIFTKCLHSGDLPFGSRNENEFRGSQTRYTSDFSFTPVEWGKKGGEVVKIIGRSICFRCESHASFIMGISMCRYYIFFRGLF